MIFTLYVLLNKITFEILDSLTILSNMSVKIKCVVDSSD